MVARLRVAFKFGNVSFFSPMLMSTMELPALELNDRDGKPESGAVLPANP